MTGETTNSVGDRPDLGIVTPRQVEPRVFQELVRHRDGLILDRWTSSVSPRDFRGEFHLCPPPYGEGRPSPVPGGEGSPLSNLGSRCRDRKDPTLSLLHKFVLEVEDLVVNGPGGLEMVFRKSIDRSLNSLR